MRYKLGVALLLILSVVAVLFGEHPKATATQPASSGVQNRGSYQNEIDVEWLKGEVQELFAKNLVTQVRSCNGSSQEITYHAPYLNPPKEPPPNLPGWLHWAWKAWQCVKAPWEVRYPHQWFWDSCAHAIVLSHLDTELAKREIESLLCAQSEEGFIPHMIWNPERMHWFDRVLQRCYPTNYGSPYLHPPALAEAVEQIYKESGDLDFVTRTLPQLKKYYLYIDRTRNRGGDGLPEIIISYESGKDRSPEYDMIYGESNAGAAWRGPMAKLTFHYWRLSWDVDKIFESQRFRVKDLLFCCIYAQNLSAMSRLYAAIGDREESQLFRGKALETEQAILSKMWDEESGLFYSLDAREGKDERMKVSTVSSLIPLILDSISEEQVERVVNEHLLNPKEFWAEYPVPANPLNSTPGKGEGHIVWRGKETWIYTNWYLAKGLHKQALRFPERGEKYRGIANELTLRTYELVKEEGFREYYDAEGGVGEGAFNFGFSTLLLDMVYDMGEIK